MTTHPPSLLRWLRQALRLIGALGFVACTLYLVWAIWIAPRFAGEPPWPSDGMLGECRIQEIGHSDSPDGKRRARAFSQHCANSADYEIWLAILNLQTQREARGFLRLKGPRANLQMQWMGERDLLVSDFDLPTLVEFFQPPQDFARIAIQPRPGQPPP